MTLMLVDVCTKRVIHWLFPPSDSCSAVCSFFTLHSVWSIVMTGAIDQEIPSLLSVSAINQKDGMKTRNPFFRES